MCGNIYGIYVPYDNINKFDITLFLEYFPKHYQIKTN